MLTNYAPDVTELELREYFNALITHLVPDLPEYLMIKNVEFPSTRQFAIITCNSKQAKHILKPLQELIYKDHKMILSNPKIYFE